jgi:hypothetical protein
VDVGISLPSTQVPALISQAQLRSYIERALSPLACELAVDGDGSLTLRVFEPLSGQVNLVVTGIKPGKLHNDSDLQQMVEELRYELGSSGLRRLWSGE